MCRLEGLHAVNFRLKPFKAAVLVGNPATCHDGLPWASNAVIGGEDL